MRSSQSGMSVSRRWSQYDSFLILSRTVHVLICSRSDMQLVSTGFPAVVCLSTGVRQLQPCVGENCQDWQLEFGPKWLGSGLVLVFFPVWQLDF